MEEQSAFPQGFCLFFIFQTGFSTAFSETKGVQE